MTTQRWRESTFKARVVRAARDIGWLAYHVPRSDSGQVVEKGFPDLVLVKPPRVIFAELKFGKGKLRPAQEVWMHSLTQCTGVETYVWRPDDWDGLLNVLGGVC